jgi:hypothetical protein
MPKKTDITPNNEEPVLVTVAKAVGSAAGKIASIAGATSEAPAPAPRMEKKGKLLPKNTTRLPRKQKKANQKRQARKDAPK